MEAQAKETISFKMDTVLERMHRQSEKFRVVDEPTRFFHNLCLYTWANSHSPLAGERAYALFRDMETRYRTGNVAVRPDTESYMFILISLGFGVATKVPFRHGRQAGDQTLGIEPHRFSIDWRMRSEWIETRFFQTGSATRTS
jgi:hypothetical protein